MTEQERRPWWRRRPPTRRVLTIAGAVLLGGFVWLWWQGVPALFRSAELAPDTKLTAADQLKAITDTRTALLAGLAAVGALGTFLVNARTQRFTAETLRISEKHFQLAERSQRESFRLTELGHLTDRYAKAIEHLGSDKLDVRLGGIYALEQLATDSPEDRRDRDQATIVEVLSAFVRVHCDPLPKDAPPEPARQERQEAADSVGERERPAVDVQAAVTVLGRLPLRPGIQRADLFQANLTGANLRGANLTGANLGEATLTGATLAEASLTEADLGGANLTEADLGGANLTEADLGGASLTEADLGGANLTEADLGGANLTEADLVRANLTEANLVRANLTEANLARANLTEATLLRANLTEANLVQANLTEATLAQANLTEAYLAETNLTAADLGGANLTEADLGAAIGVAQEQLNGAIGNERTVLPAGLQRPASWSESEGQEPG